MPCVLVVDDDPDLRDIIRVVLGGAGFSVLDAKNGMEALRILETRPVDLIVLDIFMPELGGLDVLENMPLRHRKIPVIAMSGGADRGVSEPLQRAQKLGASRVLPKPFQVEALQKAALELTARAQAPTVSQVRPAPG